MSPLILTFVLLLQNQFESKIYRSLSFMFPFLFFSSLGRLMKINTL